MGAGSLIAVMSTYDRMFIVTLITGRLIGGGRSIGDHLLGLYSTELITND